MNRTFVVSSHLQAVGYDPVSLKLEVEFRDGKVYIFPEIAPKIYQSLMNAPSQGAYFNRNIRDAGHEPYRIQ